MGLGGTEIVLLLLLVILLFGGKKLPQLGSAMGRAITNFKDGMKGKQNDQETDS